MSLLGCFCPECSWSSVEAYDGSAREACLEHELETGHKARYGHREDVAGEL